MKNLVMNFCNRTRERVKGMAQDKKLSLIEEKNFNWEDLSTGWF